MRDLGLMRSCLLGAATVVLFGCRVVADESPGTPPPVVPTPKTAESPEPSPVPDPAAAARLAGVRRALDEGMQVDKADRDGRTLLMMAAFEGHAEVVELLIEREVEVNRRDASGRTAIMYASSGPFPKTVELLAKNGANVNLVDSAEGWTALMFAAAEGHRPVVEVLLRHGANIEKADQDGDTAIDHARQREQAHIVVLLESWPNEQKPVLPGTPDR